MTIRRRASPTRRRSGLSRGPTDEVGPAPPGGDAGPMAEPSALGRQRVPKRGDADRHIVIGKTPMMPRRFANDDKTKSVPPRRCPPRRVRVRVRVRVRLRHRTRSRLRHRSRLRSRARFRLRHRSRLRSRARFRLRCPCRSRAAPAPTPCRCRRGCRWPCRCRARAHARSPGAAASAPAAPVAPALPLPLPLSLPSWLPPLSLPLPLPPPLVVREQCEWHSSSAIDGAGRARASKGGLRPQPSAGFGPSGPRP